MMKKKVVVGFVFLLIALGGLAFWHENRLRYKEATARDQSPKERPIRENLSSGIETLHPGIGSLSFTNPLEMRSSRSATTSQFISRGGVSDTSELTPSEVIIVYSGDVLAYQNKTLGFEFGLPSFGKVLRLNDSGSYSRRSDALVWIWFTKNYDIATANFFVTPTSVSSVSELSFDYNFEGYPKYMGTTAREIKIVDTVPSLEETVSYESGSPDYPNTWKFIHVLHKGYLCTFGVQVEPIQALNREEAEQMIALFKSTFHFLEQ